MEDFGFVVLENLLFGAAACRSSQNDTFRPAKCKSFFSAQRDEIALDFSNKPEGEAEDLAVYRVVKPVSFFYSIDADSFLQTVAHDGHDVCKVSTQA